MSITVGSPIRFPGIQLLAVRGCSETAAVSGRAFPDAYLLAPLLIKRACCGAISPSEGGAYEDGGATGFPGAGGSTESSSLSVMITRAVVEESRCLSG
eukprot:86339-Rhodomonas_salina.1